jgi:hypothetical protein
LIDESRERLNGLFNEEDYPAPEEIGSCFGFKLDISPFPNAGDFRVQLQEDDIMLIRTEIQGRMEEAVKGAMQDVWSRLYQQVQRMAERLKDLDEPIRWDYVADLRALLEILPRLNLTEDPNLDKMVREAKLKLAGSPTEVLKNDAAARGETAANAAAILDAMAGYMGG